MERIAAKLREYFESQGITQQNIADRFGVSKQSIHPYMTGAKPFGRKVAQKWAEEFGLSASWLLTGEGDMFGGSAKKVDGSPCFDLVTIQGGTGHGNGMEALTMDMSIGTMSVPGIPVGEGIPYIKVRGSSMVNRRDPVHSIPEGAWIGIRPSQSSAIRWGEVYAIMTTDGAIVKKVMPGSDADHITLVSYNEEDGFLPYELPTTEIIPPLYHIVAVITAKTW